MGILLAALRIFRTPLLAAAALLAIACSDVVGERLTETAPSSVAGNGTSQPAGRRCMLVTAGTGPVDTGSISTDALFLSGEQYICADDVVVVSDDDLNEVAVAAQLAAALDGPLLFPHPRLAAEIGRLKPRNVHIVGSAETLAPPDAEVIRLDIGQAVAATQEALGAISLVRTPSTPSSLTVVQTVAAITSGVRVAAPATTDTGVVDSPDPGIAVEEIVRSLATDVGSGTTWVVDGTDPVTTLLAAASASSVDASLLAIDGSDVLGYPEVAEAFSDRSAEDVRFVGSMPEDSDWELGVLANGQQVPGGGFHVLPREDKRRYIAFYGHPDTTALGALGEQGPEETLERMQPFLEAYSADGSQTIPTFEMIASVASAGPTDDDDYSFEWPISTFEGWVETARENDTYVVLDLQPGRDDFLTQAMFYEELLELPFVGLALDPEWRLGPDQRHLQQVGRVDASEVNEVIHWLADLVRDNQLPQKMLIVHQFRKTMIQNRDQLDERKELQLIIQMDGDGLESQKDNTYAQLLEGAEDAFWSWGWKNFFDEDEPGPPTPEATMSKDPSPVYVSYQ